MTFEEGSLFCYKFICYIVAAYTALFYVDIIRVSLHDLYL